MTPDEEAADVPRVAEAKTAALRMSLDAVERQGMPFVGEDRGIGPVQGMGSVPARRTTDDRAADHPRRRRASARSRSPILSLATTCCSCSGSTSIAALVDA